MRPYTSPMCALSLLCVVHLAGSAPVLAQDSSAPTAGASTADLSGLWSAKKWFGPDVRGRLIIERTGYGLLADIAGREARVTQKGQELTFELPGKEGSFSGRLEGPGLIRGHWLRQDRPSASPVMLKADGDPVNGSVRSIRARTNSPSTSSPGGEPTARTMPCSETLSSTSATSAECAGLSGAAIACGSWRAPTTLPSGYSPAASYSRKWTVSRSSSPTGAGPTISRATTVRAWSIRGPAPAIGTVILHRLLSLTGGRSRPSPPDGSISRRWNAWSSRSSR